MRAVRSLALPVVVGLALRIGVAGLTLVVPHEKLALEAVAPERSTLAERIHRRPAVAPLTGDEWVYDEVARSIVAGEGMIFHSRDHWSIARAGTPTALTGAGYPLFVAAVYAVSGGAFLAVVAVQIALAGWAIALVGRVGAEVGGAITGRLAAWAAALHPGLLLMPSLMMSEALSTVLAAAALAAMLAWARGATTARWAALGAVLGIGLLVRSPLAIALGCAVLALVASRRPERWRRGLATVGLATLVVVSPWAIRNLRVFGTPLVTDTRAGTNVFNFNHTGIPISWDLQVPEGQSPVPIEGLSEPEASAEYMRRGLAFVRSEPGAYADLSAIRAARFWWPIPKRIGSAVTLVGAIAYGLLTLFGSIGVVRLTRGRHPLALPILVGIGVYWAMAALVASGLRHRLSIEAWLLVAAGMGAAWVLRVIFPHAPVGVPPAPSPSPPCPSPSR